MADEGCKIHSARLLTLLQNAKVVAKLQPYDKLRTSINEFTVDKPLLITGFVRLLMSESRYRNFDAITETVNELHQYLQSDKKEIVELVQRHLEGIDAGIAVLMVTYSDDPRAVAKLDTTRSLIAVQSGAATCGVITMQALKQDDMSDNGPVHEPAQDGVITTQPVTNTHEDGNGGIDSSSDKSS